MYLFTKQRVTLDQSNFNRGNYINTMDDTTNPTVPTPAPEETTEGTTPSTEAPSAPAEDAPAETI